MFIYSFVYSPHIYIVAALLLSLYIYTSFSARTRPRGGCTSFLASCGLSQCLSTTLSGLVVSFWHYGRRGALLRHLRLHFGVHFLCFVCTLKGFWVPVAHPSPFGWPWDSILMEHFRACPGPFKQFLGKGSKKAPKLIKLRARRKVSSMFF